MSSRGAKAEEERQHREYRVSDPRHHPQGFTEYRVTATVVSKKKADVKEITVFKRYSDFKKLHSELSYIHRNLFRKSEEFPAFPRAQVFGRFDEAVIEERRRCAEEMLQFTVNIPALYNSPQLKDLFKDGKVSQPLDLAAAHDAPRLPAPLIPLPSGAGELPGSWPSLAPPWPESGGLTQSPGRNQVDGGETERADSHCSSLKTHRTVDEEDAGQEQEEETGSPFDSGAEEEHDEARLQAGSPLSDTELAFFDPCAKDAGGDPSAERREAVKKKTAEYLKHAETIFTLHLKESVPKDVPPSS
ncbi:sorting nexin-15 isoform X2 [Scyliorhinus torazame]|uniref:sorting nexin-15 isoform X2 n=1 Tax=Scyliorhinus torazame TaxID=75743 RepID=UPI003B5C2262